jgi:hypothetical protein
MSNLSVLEKLPLESLVKSIAEISKIHQQNSDSFSDTTCEQYNINPDEKLVFDAFMDVVKKFEEELPNLIKQCDLINDHFLITRSL